MPGSRCRETYRAATVHKDEVEHVRRPADPREGPAPLAPRGAGAHPRARPGRGPRRGHGERDQLQHGVDLDLRARRRPSGSSSATAAPRSSPGATTAVPRRRLRPRGRRAARGPRRHEVEAGHRGRRPLPLGRARGRRGPRRHDDGPAAADLGVRDELRRARRARDRQGQPADAQADAPDVGGGGIPRARQQHGLPPADLPERRAHEARRPGAHLGRVRRAGLLRHPDGARRRRDPDLRGVLPREGDDLPRDGRGAHHRPVRRGLPVLERGRHRAGPAASGSGSARGSAS